VPTDKIRLKPALRRLWRSPDTLQIGLDPPHGSVVCGLEPDDRHVIALLDEGCDRDILLGRADEGRGDSHRRRELLALLADADAIDTDPGPLAAELRPELATLSLLHRGPTAAALALQARAHAAVSVYGAGRVGATLAGLLAASGVGTVNIVDAGAMRPVDVCPTGVRPAPHLVPRPTSRADAVVDAFHPRVANPVTAAPTAEASGRHLAVLAAAGATADPVLLARISRVPHLVVTVRETTALIGPLVQPGRGPCLRCVELDRADRDPAWPTLAAQLVGERSSDDCPDVVLVALAAALTATQALGYLEADSATPLEVASAMLVLDRRELRLRRRTVRTHPACGCDGGPAAGTMAM
jgi:bacteriocin biosynthesis cyclodehydratase domain-containing protein